MTCRERKRLIHKIPQAYSEEVTATGPGTEDFTNRLFNVKGFRDILLFVNLPAGTSPGAGNLPVGIKAYAVSDDGDAAGSRQLILDKCLDGVTGWNGAAFLEINETHIGRFLDYSDDGDYDHMYFSIEGPASTVYEVIVVLCNPEFESPDNVLEAFTK